MYEYYLNIFRPYHHNCRNEMSVTRAFAIACAKAGKGSAFFQEVLNMAGLNVSLSPSASQWGLEVPGNACRSRQSVLKEDGYRSAE